MKTSHHFKARTFGQEVDGAVSVLPNDDGTMTVAVSVGPFSQSIKMSREDCWDIGEMLTEGSSSSQRAG